MSEQTLEVGEWDFSDMDEDPDEYFCWQCNGDGWGFSGEDWDEDPLWTAPGTVERCPNCRGSGRASDCWYW